MPRNTRSITTATNISKKINPETSSYKRINEETVPDDKNLQESKKFKDAVSLSNVKKGKVSTKNAKFIGAHVSIAGGIHKSVLEAHDLGANAFALFLKSNHQWKAKPLDTKDIELFKKYCAEYKYSPHMIVPHACYLLNIAAPKNETLTKSREALILELKRCEELGLTLLNIHPGSTCGTISKEEGIQRCAQSINMALAETNGVTILVENMCGQGNTLGGNFQELKDIISQVTDQERIGICLDTCHAFAYGYDLSNENGFEKMMSDLDSIVGLNFLKAVHLNDSTGGVGSHLDRHANIGNGKIGIEGFRRIMKDNRFHNIPMVLETPPKLGYKKEINLLKKLCC